MNTQKHEMRYELQSIHKRGYRMDWHCCLAYGRTAAETMLANLVATHRRFDRQPRRYRVVCTDGENVTVIKDNL